MVRNNERILLASQGSAPPAVGPFSLGPQIPCPGTQRDMNGQCPLKLKSVKSQVLEGIPDIHTLQMLERAWSAHLGKKKKSVCVGHIEGQEKGPKLLAVSEMALGLQVLRTDRWILPELSPTRPNTSALLFPTLKCQAKVV